MANGQCTSQDNSNKLDEAKICYSVMDFLALPSTLASQLRTIADFHDDTYYSPVSWLPYATPSGKAGRRGPPPTACGTRALRLQNLYYALLKRHAYKRE
ncbi:hypothetical protein EVAR_6851_1 [Eumeta japonica]|uniref:Uncharacterized protein n=1 Tax=Eumeta variegata TaxID=151549 RepID=A0A4C1U6E6_EUMVA|nr:hypothetical protein EVAR_6851_1 [Eumeta japonica]